MSCPSKDSFIPVKALNRIIAKNIKKKKKTSISCHSENCGTAVKELYHSIIKEFLSPFSFSDQTTDQKIHSGDGKQGMFRELFICFQNIL